MGKGQTVKKLESCTEKPRLYPEGSEEPLKAVKLEERAEMFILISFY